MILNFLDFYSHPLQSITRVSYLPIQPIHFNLLKPLNLEANENLLALE